MQVLHVLTKRIRSHAIQQQVVQLRSHTNTGWKIIRETIGRGCQREQIGKPKDVLRQTTTELVRGDIDEMQPILRGIVHKMVQVAIELVIGQDQNAQRLRKGETGAHGSDKLVVR